MINPRMNFYSAIFAELNLTIAAFSNTKKTHRGALRVLLTSDTLARKTLLTTFLITAFIAIACYPR